MNTTLFRTKLEQACAEDSLLDVRFAYDRKLCLGMGGYGVVYQEPQVDDDRFVLQKINPITVRALKKDVSRRILSVDSVKYDRVGKKSYVIFNGQEAYSLGKKELHNLKVAMAESTHLRLLQGVGYFPKMVEQEWFSEGYSDPVASDREFFLLDGKLCLRTIREQVPGVNLFDLLGEWFHPLDIVKVAYDLGRALQCMEGAGIIHRDVKSSNVVYNLRYDEKQNHCPGEGEAYLIDFGGTMRQKKITDLENITYFWDDLTECVDLFSLEKKDIFGTPGYIAPEVLFGSEATSYGDRWSLGCLLYTAIVGDAAFHTNADTRVFTDGRKSELHEKMNETNYFNLDFVEAICSLFSVNPEERNLNLLLFEAEEILFCGKGGKLSDIPNMVPLRILSGLNNVTTLRPMR